MPFRSRHRSSPSRRTAVLPEPPPLSRRGGNGVQRLITMLTARIVSGELPPGRKISEPELARELDASRGLVREAIRWLEAMEMVERVPNVGPRVTVFSPRDIIEFFEVREAIEGCAARLAATNMSDQDLMALRAHVERVRDTGKGQLVELQKDGGIAPDFHTLILRGSRNGRLCRMLNENTFLLMQLWQRQHGWFARGNPTSQRDHFRIVEALENRDGECAEILMRRHIARLREHCIEHFNLEAAAEHQSAKAATPRRRIRNPARRAAGSSRADAEAGTLKAAHVAWTDEQRETHLKGERE